jgi:tRNA pseudouridine(38-40) synthase
MHSNNNTFISFDERSHVKNWHPPGGVHRATFKSTFKDDSGRQILAFQITSTIEPEDNYSGKVEGRHDFRGFCANSGSLPDDTHRTLHRVTVRERGSAISITLKGEGFLYRMARMIVGGMVRVARGRDDTASFCRRLHGGKPWPAPVTAPAEGLYLVKVLYSKGEKSR